MTESNSRDAAKLMVLCSGRWKDQQLYAAELALGHSNALLLTHHNTLHLFSARQQEVLLWTHHPHEQANPLLC
jgi:hypothetical protein